MDKDRIAGAAKDFAGKAESAVGGLTGDIDQIGRTLPCRRRIRRFVEDRVGRPKIEPLPLRFAAVATELRCGLLQVLDRGDLGLAVQASPCQRRLRSSGSLPTWTLSVLASNSGGAMRCRPTPRLSRPLNCQVKVLPALTKRSVSP